MAEDEIVKHSRAVIYLHESLLTRIDDLNKYYFQFQQKLSTQLIDNVTPDSSLYRFGNEERLLREPKTRIMMELGRTGIIKNFLPAYDSGITRSVQVIQQIDEELK